MADLCKCGKAKPLGMPAWARYPIASCETCYEAKRAKRFANRKAKLQKQAEAIRAKGPA